MIVDQRVGFKHANALESEAVETWLLSNVQRVMKT